MHFVAREGNRKLVSDLLDGGKFPDEGNDKMRTPLHLAAKYGRSEIATLLLPNVEAQDEDRYGYTPLHLAAKRGHFNIVCELLTNIGNTKTALLQDRTHNGLTSMHLAARNGHMPIVARLLASSPGLINAVDNGGKTALHYAAEAGHAAIVTLLAGQSPNSIVTTSHEGWNALHFAVNSCQAQVVALLVAYRPELVDMADRHGKKPADLAAKHGLEEIKAQLVVPAAAALESTLRFAIVQSHHERVKELLDESPELIDFMDADSFTALYHACSEGRSDMVSELLVRKPMWIDPRCIWAALKHPDHCEWILTMLLASQPSLASSVDPKGNTVLHRVIGFRKDKELFSNEIVLKVLSLAPDSIHSENNYHSTPLEVAIRHENFFAIGAMQWKLSMDTVFQTFSKCGVKKPNLRPIVTRQCRELAEALPVVVLQIVNDYLWFVNNPFSDDWSHSRKRRHAARSLFGTHSDSDSSW